MGTYDFQDIAKLLNYSRTTQIQTDKPKGRDGRWALYGGTHKVHTSSYPFRVLYLNSAVTLADIKAALQEVGGLNRRRCSLSRFNRKEAPRQGV